MAVKLGLDAKLYKNDSTYESPDWTELTNVKDVNLNMEKGDADVTTRANKGWRASKATLKEATVEFDMLWDTEDEGFSAIQDAYFNDTAIEMAVMDGDITVPGSEGLRASFDVMSFQKKEPLEEAQMVSVTLKVTASDNAPEWLVVAAS
jgi:hypothetical protein